MAKRSAGLLLYRTGGGQPEVLLVHPGGPFWAKRDAGAWSIPKGEYENGGDPLACALREFKEETGTALGPTVLVELGSVKQKGGKLVSAWAAEGDLDADAIASNSFTMEWPPRSGKTAEVPEVDRIEFFSLDEARTRTNSAQAVFLERLADLQRT